MAVPLLTPTSTRCRQSCDHLDTNKAASKSKFALVSVGVKDKFGTKIDSKIGEYLPLSRWHRRTSGSMENGVKMRLVSNIGVKGNVAEAALSAKSAKKNLKSHITARFEVLMVVAEGGLEPPTSGL